MGGGSQVALHHGGRRHLHVGNVVEACADGVGRQVGAHVEVKPEQRAHRGPVLRAIESLKRPASRVGVGRRCGVKGGLEPGHQRHSCGRVRLRMRLGRHHAGPQLADHFFSQLGLVGGASRVKPIERHLTLQVDVVVTVAAEFLERVVLRRRRHHGRFRRRRASRARGGARP